MAAAVFVTALLDFVGLAALLPVLYYLLEGGENQRAAILLSVGGRSHSVQEYTDSGLRPFSEPLFAFVV